jgi:hypothetical protein
MMTDHEAYRRSTQRRGFAKEGIQDTVDTLYPDVLIYGAALPCRVVDWRASFLKSAHYYS